MEGRTSSKIKISNQVCDKQSSTTKSERSLVTFQRRQRTYHLITLVLVKRMDRKPKLFSETQNLLIICLIKARINILHLVIILWARTASTSMEPNTWTMLAHHPSIRSRTLWKSHKGRGRNSWRLMERRRKSMLGINSRRTEEEYWENRRCIKLYTAT